MSNRDMMKRVFENMAFPVYDGSQINPVSIDKITGLKNKRVTVILTGSDIALDSTIKNLKYLKEKGFYITVVLTKAAEILISKEAIEKELDPNRIVSGDGFDEAKGLITNTDYCILPNLTQNTLAKVAVGIQDDLAATLIWQFLLAGVKTIVNTDSIFHGWFSIDMNPIMKKVMENHLVTIESYGASLVEDHKYLDYIDVEYEESKKGESEKTEKSASQTLDSKASKLVTESTIRGLSANIKELVIEKGMIITPLAKDAAKIKGVNLIFKK